jgi:hypothetical protein
MLVSLTGVMTMRSVRMRMNVLMLMRVNQVAVTMFMGVLMDVLMHMRLSRFGFIFFHRSLLFSGQLPC